MNLIFAAYDLRIENQPPFGGSMRGSEKWFKAWEKHYKARCLFLRLGANPLGGLGEAIGYRFCFTSIETDFVSHQLK